MARRRGKHSPSQRSARVGRLSRKKHKLLEHLRERGTECFGLDMVRAGAGPLGTIYVYLSQLEDMGWVASREVPSGTEGFEQRRVYKITDAGREKLEER